MNIYKNTRFPLDLQLFAEGDGAGADGGNGDGAGAGTEGASGSERMSFEDFLKLEGNQAEFDRRVQKATKTAVENAQQKWQALTDDKLSEAEKLAKMTKAERDEYEISKLKKQIADYERKDALADMTKTARTMLSEKGITVSDSLVAMLVSEDAEATKAAVDGFAKAFSDELERALNDKLKGKTPEKGSGKSVMTKEQILEIRDPELRQQKMLENRELFNF